MDQRTTFGKINLVRCCIVFTWIAVASCASKGMRDIWGSRPTVVDSSYEIYASGSSADVAPKTTPLLLLVGGGLDRVDAMSLFVNRAGFGDVVVLRESGSDGYNTFLVKLGANSVTSIVIKSKDATTSPEVLDHIRRAEAIFFAGGDQANYARHIANSPVSDAINAAAMRGIPIGGTSAGLAILGEFYFPAYKDTITSDDSLKNPFHERLILDRQLLALSMLKGVITDSHFRNRDRLGRLITFMARILNDDWASEIRAVGLDEEVALAIEANGEAHVFADEGSAYLLESLKRPEVCEAGRPLTLPEVLVRKMSRGSQFNFKRWPDFVDGSYKLTVRSGKISADGRPIY